ncbi:MAG: arylsulfatase [Pirellulales bacterium]
MRHQLWAYACAVVTLFLATPKPSVTAAETGAAERPNIVFIMADDLGYGHLGCYGQTTIRTPRLNALAESGVRFTDCYAGCCVCAPSRSVLMTGLHGGHTPVRGNTGGIALADDDVTVAEVLKAAGYATGLFGKWGLGEYETTGVPYRQGFDEFFGYLHQIHAHFYYPPYLWHGEQRYELPGNAHGGRGQYTHDEIVAKALDFVRRHREEPFFLYVPFAVPHYELLLPEESQRPYAGQFPEAPYTGRSGRPPGYPSDYGAQAMPRAATAGVITHMDRSVGRLLDLLDELELADNTIVFFTSDNGATPGPSDPDFFEACGPLRGTKMTLYEGGLRVPMIVRWPGRIAAGRVSDHAWTFADVLPTLAELAGANVPDGMDGHSVATELCADGGESEQAEHDYLYWEYDGGRAVRAGDWKLIRSADGALELYDLANDVGERCNLAEQQRDEAARLGAYLDEAHVEPPPQIEPAPINARRFR